MLSIRENKHEKRTLDVQLGQPYLYLDHHVISHFSNTSKYVSDGEEIRDLLLRIGGTLVFSWAHLFELFRLDNSAAYYKCRNYLKSYGSNFLMIDSDPLAVIKKEKQWKPGKEHPALHEELLKILPNDWDGESQISISIIMDHFTSNPFFESKKRRYQSQKKQYTKKLISDTKERNLASSELKEEAHHTPNSTPTEDIFDKVIDMCVKKGGKLNPDDAFDLWHLVVPTSYCEYVVIDKEWSEMTTNIDISNGHTLYRMIQLDELKTALKEWQEWKADLYCI